MEYIFIIAYIFYIVEFFGYRGGGIFKKYLSLLLIASFFVVFPNNTGAEELIKVGEVGNDLDVVFPTAIVDPGVGGWCWDYCKFETSKKSLRTERLKIIDGKGTLYVKANQYDVVAEIRFVYGLGLDTTVHRIVVKSGQSVLVLDSTDYLQSYLS